MCDSMDSIHDWNIIIYIQMSVFLNQIVEDPEISPLILSFLVNI
jgi:hypothetical protein